MKPSREQRGVTEFFLYLIARWLEPRDRDGKPTKNDLKQWYERKTTLIQVLNLIAVRTRLRQYNLYDTEQPRDYETDSESDPDVKPQRARLRTDERTIDGSCNDLRRPWMGRAGTRFGRNVPRDFTYEESKKRLLDPNPREVSNKLMQRKRLQKAETINLLSVGWLQFMVHDWLGHGENEPEDPIEVPLPAGDSWVEDPMRVKRTKGYVRRRSDLDAPPAYVNVETHWWDASQLYGSSGTRCAQVREGDSARLRLERLDSGEATLPVGRVQKPTGPRNVDVEVAGVNENWWVGLSLMHTLFAQEHNAIVDRLREVYSDWDEERLFQKARLINAALMAKIHTIEWTPALLTQKAITRGLNINWWGLMGESRVKKSGRIFRSEFLSGIPGSETRHHAADYSITEEFVAVYRMHGLLPDDVTFTNPQGTFKTEMPLPEISFDNVVGFYRRVSHSDAMYSFGVANPGKLCLNNYPNTLRELKRPGTNKPIDLATIDIVRDRERGVPRYNAFRELIGKPRLGRDDFEGINKDPEVCAALRGVYDTVDKVDLMVGLYAEEVIDGLAFSETAFRVFILMANRRLKSDRFYTVDYTPEVYTPEGIEWIEHRTMADVIATHYPSLSDKVKGLKNVFHPWDAKTNIR